MVEWENTLVVADRCKLGDDLPGLAADLLRGRRAVQHRVSDDLQRPGRSYWLLDGVLVAGSLFTITWVSALVSVVHAGGDSRFAFGVSLAYPVTDLVLLTLTVVVVGHARQGSRSGLGLLAACLGLLCLADSGFAYLIRRG